MPKNRKLDLGILALLVLVFSAKLLAQEPQQGAGLVTRYIESLQKLDYRTILDLSYRCQRDVAAIKAQNPEEAWTKLVEEYYESKISSLTTKPEFWRVSRKGLSGATGELTQQIRVLTRLLPQSTKWSIIDARSDHVEGSIQFGAYNRTVVSVSTRYSSIEESPIVDGKCLKEAILQFEIHAKSQLVVTVGRLPKDDVNWSKVPAYIILEPRGYLTDSASVIPAAEAQRIEARCAVLDRRRLAQIAIVTVPLLEGDSLEKVALNLFTRWEIGASGKNNGILLIFAIREQQSRITVGPGLENVISDEVAAVALKEMRPDLRNGDYESAINVALDLLVKRIEAIRAH
jgi:hypothetical protein